MYKINRVHEENLKSLIHIFEAQHGKSSEREHLLRRKIERREGIYYILEQGENILGYAHWIQDREKDAWIRLQTIGMLAKEEQNILKGTEELIFASEMCFRMLYENSFERAQVLGARFQRSHTNNALKRMYRSLGYRLIDDDPLELWEKLFARRELATEPQLHTWKPPP